MGVRGWSGLIRVAAMIGVSSGLGAAGCFGDDDDDDEYGIQKGTLGPAERCADEYPQMCTTGVCEDVVGGILVEGGSSTDFDTPGNEGTICTKRCAARSDCNGLDFAAANEVRVETQTWRCEDGVCAVRITPIDTGSSDICDGCGGALCSGDCIGCPQCR